MGVDLTGMSRKDLEKLKSDVEKALKTAAARDLKAAKRAAEKAAAEFGFSLTEVSGPEQTVAPTKRKYKKRKPTADKGVAKYRNPENTDQTWTGKGRQPNWFRTAMANGIDPASMAI